MPTLFTADMFGLPAATLNLIALIAITLIGLLILFFLFRMIRRPRFAGGRRSKHTRLAVTDAALIDERRKLVLVRRDDVEHLVLIGGASDLVIEGNIRKNAPARPVPQPNPAQASAPATAQPSNSPSLPSTPRPAVPDTPSRPPIPQATSPSAPTVSASKPASPAPSVSAAVAPVSSAATKLKTDVSSVKDRSVDQMDALLDEISPKK